MNRKALRGLDLGLRQFFNPVLADLLPFVDRIRLSIRSLLRLSRSLFPIGVRLRLPSAFPVSRVAQEIAKGTNLLLQITILLLQPVQPFEDGGALVSALGVRGECSREDKNQGESTEENPRGALPEGPTLPGYGNVQP